MPRRLAKLMGRTPAAERATRVPLTLMRLEDRIVLDAAAPADADSHTHGAAPLEVAPAHPGHAVAVRDAGESPHVPAAPESHGPDLWGDLLGAFVPGESPPAEGPRVLLVSSALEQAGTLAAAHADGVITLVFDAAHTTPELLLQELRTALGDQRAAGVALATHGAVGGGFQLLAGEDVTLITLQGARLQTFWRELGQLVARDGRIDLLACDAADGVDGAALLDALEHVTGANVAASDDATGHSRVGGDWVLESDGVRVAPLYFDPGRLAAFDHTLAASTLTDTNPGQTAVGGGGAVVVDPNIQVTEGVGGDGQMQGAWVRLMPDTFVPGQDFLGLNATGAAAVAGIPGGAWSYDATTGELLIRGNAAPATYETILQNVVYYNTSTMPDTTPREVFFVLGDDFIDGLNAYYNAFNGHYYRLSNTGGAQTWNDAVNTAAALTTGNLPGYLATITSFQENSFIAVKLAAGFPDPYHWIGAGSDAGQLWRWVTGPEGLADGGAGLAFWSGNWPTGALVDPGLYAGWAAGEPNAAFPAYAVMQRPGPWFDQLGTAPRLVAEYGGLPTDAEGLFAASVLVNVETPNHAPVLDAAGAMWFATIFEDATGGVGNTVASLIASAGGDRITDYNGDPEGIALIALDAAHGTWQYSVNGGATWMDLGSVSATNALLLRDSDLLRFLPDADYNGTLTSAITFRAWDRTSGSAGSYVDASSTGGATAFSTASETAALTVEAVNDAPAIGTPLADHAASEDAPFSYTLAADSFVDVDASDTLTYTATLADGSALPAWLTFDPLTRTFSGTPLNGDVGMLSLRVTATDDSGASASDVFQLTVANVNDAPYPVTPLADQDATAGEPVAYQFGADAFADDDADDTLSYSALLADGSALPTWLVFDPATRTFSGTPTAGDVGTLSIRVVARDAAGATAESLFVLTVAAGSADDGVPEIPTNPVAPADPTPPRGSGQPASGGASAATGEGGPGEGESGGAHDAAAGAAFDPVDFENTGGDDLFSGPVEPAGGGAADDGGGTAAEASGAAHAPGMLEGGGAAAAGATGAVAVTRNEPGGMLAHDLEEEIALLSSQVSDAMFSGSLLDDPSQPAEFRAAWTTILGAFEGSGVVLSAYLQSAFRAVTEAALIYESASQAVAALQAELQAAAEAGRPVAGAELLAAVEHARADVRLASTELEAAIRSAAEAGSTERFDQVLEDMVTAILQRLMEANAHLFVEAQAASAAARVLRDARLAELEDVSTVPLAEATDAARAAAQHEITEMRKCWDRIARDVFSAFINELVARKPGGPAISPVQ